MLFEEYFSYWSTRWEEAMKKSEHFSLNIRSEDETIRIWDHISKTYDHAMGADLRRVEAVLHQVEKSAYVHKDSIVLDIGSGTGAYTLPFAKLCKKVYALDPSPGMCEVLEKKAKASGIDNIEVIAEDWRKVSLKEKGMYKQYDFVISSLNTGIADAEALTKMNEASRGACCYVTAAGFAQNNVSGELNRLVLGRDLKKAGGNDIIHAFNIIYAMGCFPELFYADCAWSKVDPYAQAVDRICENYWRYMEITGEIREKICRYIKEHLNAEGNFVETFQSKLGIMLWKV